MFARTAVAILFGSLLLLVRSAAISRSDSDLVVHEKRNAAPTQWTKRDRVPAKAMLPVRIALKQTNLEKGHDFLMDVSHPDSPNYGKHWTPKQVHDMFAPATETVETVRLWLNESGISMDRVVLSDNRAWLAFDAMAEEVESLLNTKYHVYEHATKDQMAAACDEYHLPSHIQKHIDYVTPGLKLITTTKKTKRSTAVGKSTGKHTPPVMPVAPEVLKYNISSLKTCDVLITPECVKALYKVPPATKAHPNNSLGVIEEGNWYSPSDLDMFYAQYAPYIPAGTQPIPQLVDGATALAPNGQGYGEPDLDFELAYPLIYPQTTTLFQLDDYDYAVEYPTEGFLNTFLDAIDGAYGETGDDPILDPVYPDPHPGGYTGQLQCGVYKPTHVVSTSYGEAEFDLPEYYQRRQCNEFMKLGLQGTSFFFSSGDYGVGGVPGDATAGGCLGPNNNIFNPQFPVNCPYVTAVGATKVYPGHSVFDPVPESAANDLMGHPYHQAYSSAGGFSNVYDAPSYQKRAISSYFAHHNPPYPYYSGNASFGANGGVYNRIGRGIPDVSANGDNTAVVVNGRYSFSGGTSAATPIFASIVNLINEERLAIGKSTVGFINPVLYENPWVLNDIVNGSNPSCGSAGFSAVPGWDPVTGLGTPNFPKMLALFLSLP